MMPTVYCNYIEHVFWNTEVADVTLSDSIDVWRIPVSSDAEQLAHFNTFMNPAESDRAGRYHQEKDRRRFITSRAMLKILLGKYLHQQPGDIQFIIGPNKKPFVQNSGDIDLHYNISHSGDWILLAVAKVEIGIDMEKINPDFFYEDVLRLSFSKTEMDAIKKSAHPLSYFFLYWTRKEALTKATSKGLDDNLIAVPCLDGSHTTSAEIIGTAVSCIVSSFEIKNEYIGSVAYQSTEKNIRFLDIKVKG